MAGFKTNVLPWISTILEHLGVIGTGGIIVLLIQLAEKRWPQVFNWQTSRRVFLCFVLFAIFQSWEGEHLSRVGREQDLIKTHADIEGLNRDLVFQAQSLKHDSEVTLLGLKSDCSLKEGANQTLQKQNRDQQASINGCLTQALKIITPEPFRINTFILPIKNVEGRTKDGHRGLLSAVVAITNRTIASVNVELTCTSPFGFLGAGLSLESAGGFELGSDRREGDSKSAKATIMSPWNSGEPLLFTLSTVDKIPTSCTVIKH